MKKLIRKVFLKLFVFSIFLFLVGCGFHLRSGEALPPQLRTLYIDAPPYAPLTLALKQSFKSAGVNVVNKKSFSPITLQILSENVDQALLNISGNTFVKTYKLTYTVQFQLLNKAGIVIYGPGNIKEISTFVSSDQQILGSNADLLSQQAALRREAIGLLFDRLGSLNVRRAVAHIKKVKQ